MYLILHLQQVFDCLQKVQRAWLQSYLGVHTGLTFLVLLMGHPLVQLAPESIGLPAGDLCLQAAVESVVVCRVEVQASAEDIESLESSFAGRGLNEVLEQLRHILLLWLSHRLR